MHPLLIVIDGTADLFSVQTESIFILSYLSLTIFSATHPTALSLNGYRPPHCDRHLMVKYAEDQHKKKDRRGQPLGSPSGMTMMDSMVMMDKQESRDPYFYSRSRVPTGMYRSQQPAPMQMGLNHMPLNPGSNSYLSSISTGYPSSRGGKNMPASMSSSPGSNPLDWYGPMPQMVYDNQMANVQSQLHNQSLGYDQQSMNQQMMSQGQSQQHPSQSQGQGTIYMRSPRVVQEAGYTGSVTLVIGFLPQHADVALLHDLCAPYGRIISAQIDVDNSNTPDDAGVRGGCSGRGRVQMAGLSQAQYATQALNGAIIFEGGRPLQVLSTDPFSHPYLSICLRSGFMTFSATTTIAYHLHCFSPHCSLYSGQHRLYRRCKIYVRPKKDPFWWSIEKRHLFLV